MPPLDNHETHELHEIGGTDDGSDSRENQVRNREIIVNFFVYFVCFVVVS
jgi:hypothetical protein